METTNTKANPMNEHDKARLLLQFPETPQWILERDHSFAAAVAAMQLRREAFPAFTAIEKARI